MSPMTKTLSDADIEGLAVYFSAQNLQGSRQPEEFANFDLIARVAHAADLELLAVGELKLAAAGVRRGADAAAFAKQLRDFRGVLLHVAAADEARQHADIDSATQTHDSSYDFVQ